MVQTFQASTLTLHQVEEKFKLSESSDSTFFYEWQTDLPELTEEEKRSIDRLKANILYLLKYPVSESAVKIVVLSPLLSKANFFTTPFHIQTEASVQIELEDDDQANENESKIVKGRIDVLSLKEDLWVLVVEAKEKGFSLENAIAQALSYMMATPNPNHPAYGFATNGSEFIFLKTTQEPTPQYALSDLFTLRRQQNELYAVLRILKALNNYLSS